MAFNLGQILSAAGTSGVPAYDQGYNTALLHAGQQALGRALFAPGAQQMPPGPQAPPPGQQSVPAPRPYPTVQGAPQQQVVGNMFGGMGWRPIEMGAPPTAMVPPVQPPPYQPPPQALPPGGAAPPPASGAPFAGVGMNDPILARIAAANPGASPQVLASAYRQYVDMGRARYGLNPNLAANAQNLRAQELALRQQRIQQRTPGTQSPAAAAAPVQRAINPQTGHVIEQRDGQWVDAQSGQPIGANTPQRFTDAPVGSSAGREMPFKPDPNFLGGSPQSPNVEDRRGSYRGPQIPMEEFDRRAEENMKGKWPGLDAEALKRAPGAKELLQGVPEKDAGNIIDALSGASRSDFDMLKNATPRQRDNLREFLMDNGEFPQTDQEMQDVYGKEGPAMSTKRYGRVPGSPTKRRPYPTGQ